MSPSDYKKAKTLIQNETGSIHSVFHKLKKLEALNELMKPLLPEQAREYCQLANLKNEKAIIIVPNASLATQLRIDATAFLEKCQHNPRLQFIRAIEFKVRPHVQQKNSRLYEKNKNTMKCLSHQTAALVDKIADSISDPTLKEIMKRIAKHQEK